MTDLIMLHVIFVRATHDRLDEKVTHLPHLESTYDWAQYPAPPVITHKPWPPVKTSKRHPLNRQTHIHLPRAIDQASCYWVHSPKMRHAHSTLLVERFFPGVAYIAPHQQFGISL